MKVSEIKAEIKKCKNLLKQPNLDFESITWIELQILEHKKYLKILRREEKIKSSITK